MEQMRLLGLNDQIAEVDVTGAAIDQISVLIKTVPPDKWGDAAKSLPSDFVTQICKQGVADKASNVFSHYGPSVGVGILVGAGVSAIAKSPVYALAAGVGASLAFYLLSNSLTTKNA